MLNIIVCVKSVPGIITNVTISEGGDRLDPVVRSLYMNETDEFALEEALVLRKENGGQVTAITVGPSSSEEMLYAAIAKGADKAVRIDVPFADPETTSMVLAKAIRTFNFDLILAGLESSDNLAAQVGVSVAERLGIPFIFAVTKIEMISARKVARVTRELGGGDQQVLEVSLPALLSIQTGIQRLTLAPLAKLFQARRKGINSIAVTDHGIGKAELLKMVEWKYIEILKPKRERSTELVQGNPKEIAPKIIAKIREAL